MSIDYSKLRSITARRLISALIQDGFKLDREKGAHRQYIHPQKGRVTVSFHQPSDTFPPKTLKSIIRDAEWMEEDLKRLDLLR
ncbi:MAG: type II toxin-antitoxin system HicA family toxin [Chloroflexota bacterium]|nr:type II toxin-antitoxin system HicA family toxin [Chloroflexota bacterium]